jgi:hypothetical protein
MRDNVGSSVSFHCIDGCGYSTNIDKAHTYTLEEAQQVWESAREFDLPLCADRIDALVQFRVDFQYVKNIVNKPPYVAYKKGSWDGNDLFWKSINGGVSADFSQAEKYDETQHWEGFVFVSFDEIDAIKRRTIQTQNVNERTMTRSAGLRMPKRIKIARDRARRVSRRSGKVRWNCPSCGKINWQYNPYDFDGCGDIMCEEHRFEKVGN